MLVYLYSKYLFFFLFSGKPQFEKELTTYRLGTLLFWFNPHGTVFMLIVVVMVVVFIVLLMRTVKEKHHKICKHTANIQDWSFSQRKHFLRQTCHHIRQEFTAFDCGFPISRVTDSSLLIDVRAHSSEYMFYFVEGKQ